ncbi:MAG: CorA family divalent cation transporter [Polyangiaceae bacterium]
MFRILDVVGDGKCEVRDVASLDAVVPLAAGHWRWLDCTGASAAELSMLQERFGFHPVTIEDCATYDPRPKFEPYDDYLFIVIHSLRPASDHSQLLEARELHGFLGANYVVTVHDDPLDCIEQTWRRLTFEPTLAKRGPAYAYYMLADVALSAVFPWNRAAPRAHREHRGRDVRCAEPDLDCRSLSIAASAHFDSSRALAAAGGVLCNSQIR